jgi:heat shock protein HslJ
MRIIARSFTGVFMITLLLYVLAGCAGRFGQLEGAQLKLVGWPVTSLNPADFFITATYENGRFFGNSGINTYGGPCSLGPADTFSVWPINVTKKSGSGPALYAEAAYLTQLEQARFFTIRDGRLTLYDQDKHELLIFCAAGR